MPEDKKKKTKRKPAKAKTTKPSPRANSTRIPKPKAIELPTCGNCKHWHGNGDIRTCTNEASTWHTVSKKRGRTCNLWSVK